MKKPLLTLTLLAMLTGLTACGATETPVKEDSKLTTITDGTLKIGMEMSYAPMEYKENGNPIGFDVEMAEAIAKELNLTPEFVETDFYSIFGGLNEDEYDVIISAISYNADRDSFYALTGNYLDNKPILIAKSDSAIADATMMTDKVVAVSSGTTSEEYMKSYETATIVKQCDVYETIDEAFDALTSGKADLVCTDAVIANYFMNNDGNSYDILWEADEEEPFCIALKDTNTALRDAVQKAYKSLKSDGTMKSLSEKYFGEDLTLDME